MLIRLSASRRRCLHYPYGEKVLLQEHDIQIAAVSVALEYKQYIIQQHVDVLNEWVNGETAA